MEELQRASAAELCALLDEGVIDRIDIIHIAFPHLSRKQLSRKVSFSGF